MSKVRATKTSGDSNLALTKALQNIVKQQTAFEAAVEKCKELISEDLNDIETRFEAKRKELSDLDTKFSYDEQNRKADLDLRVKEYGYTAAKQLLEERGEVAVSKDLYESLQRDLAELRQSKADEIKQAVADEHARSAQQTEMIKRTLELQKAAEVAKVEAQLETQVNQIELLKDTIKDLKNDLDEQRKLTKDVANASANKQPVYLPSNGNGR